jgi:hypothetical protein
MYPVWRGQVSIAALNQGNTVVEYKYIVIKKKDLVEQFVKWE